MEIINLYKGFNKIYNESLSNEELVEAWYQFMGSYISVREMYIHDYENDNLNWK